MYLNLKFCESPPTGLGSNRMLRNVGGEERMSRIVKAFLDSVFPEELAKVTRDSIATWEVCGSTAMFEDTENDIG